MDNLSNRKKKKVRRVSFCERIPELQSLRLLEQHEFDLQKVAHFLATGNNRQQFLGEAYDNTVGLGRDEIMRNLDRHFEVGWEMRQFVCAPCRHRDWWRRVPKRKPVSKCKQCRVRYDFIPRDREFGWGRFDCVCGNTFGAFAMMDLSILGKDGVTGKSENFCYKCNNKCQPKEIIAPSKRDERPHRRETHTCTAFNCYNRRPVRGREIPMKICVHPKSITVKATGFGSRVHVSTGSTVDTFLTQLDDDASDSSSSPPLDSIPEDSE